MSKTAKHQCSGRTRSSTCGSRPQCKNTGKLYEDGNWWCKTHAPSTQKAKEDKWRAKRTRETEIRNAKFAVKKAYDEVVSAAESMTIHDLNGGAVRISVRALWAATRALKELQP